MAFTPVTLTFNLSNLLGTGFDKNSTKVWIETNIDGDVIIDADGNAIRLGDAKAAIVDGVGSFTDLVPTNAATNPTDFQYRVWVDYRLSYQQSNKSRNGRERWDSGWFSLTTSKDLADVATEAYVPPTWMTTATQTLQGYVDQGEDIRDETQAIRDGIIDDLGTTDSQTATLISTPGTLTDDALTASFAAREVTRIASATPASNDTEDRDLILGGDADFSNAMDVTYLKILGEDTLGTPTTGYKYTKELTPHFTMLDTTTSGHNESLSTNDGRTGATAYSTRVYHGGQGDAAAYNAYVELYSTPQPGSTHWLANAAGVILNGDNGVTYGDHLYMNTVELNHTDNGWDSAAVGIVLNFNRTNDTASQGEIWMGVRVQSGGTKAIDVGYSLHGLAKRGLDLSQATFGTDKAAVTLKADDRIYLNATTTALNGVDWYATTAGPSWLAHSTTSTAGVEVGANNARAFLVTAANSAINYLRTDAGAAGQNPKVWAEGADTNVGLTLRAKAAGAFNFQSWNGSAGTTQFLINTQTGTANYLMVTAANTGGGPQVSAAGTDTNVDIRLSPKGTGVVDFTPAPTTTTAPSAGGAGALPATPAGYVEIKVNGTPRKVAYY